MLRTGPPDRIELSAPALPALLLPGRYRLACALACALALLAAQAADADQPKTVLILASESLEMPAMSEIVREAVAVVRAAAGPTNIYTESLERSRFPADDRRLLTLFRQRYASEKPSMVVALSGPAVEFALRYRADLFPDVPLVYAFVDDRMVREMGTPPATTGVAVKADFAGLVDLAIRLHPKARRLVVVSGVSDFDRGWLRSFRETATQIEGRLAIRYLTDGTLPELLGEIATLPDDSLIFLVSMTRDRDGSIFVPRDVCDMVRRVSRAPVYGPSMTYMGHGAVGGPLMDLEAHGRDLGRLASRVLSGEAVSAIKPGVTPDRLIFDWRELDRFGISERRLPTGAEVQYRRNAWTIHRGWIVSVIALFAAQTILIVALVAQRRKRAVLQLSLDDRLGFGTLLSDVSTALNAVPLRSLEGTIRSVLERIRQYFDVDAASILDASATPVVCRVVAGSGLGDPGLAAACAVAGTPVGALKLASFQPLVMNGLEDLPRESAFERTLVGNAGIQSLAMVAMEVGGQVLGVLCCLARSRRAGWPAELQQQLRTLAEVLANALQRQQAAADVLESDRLKGAILSSMASHITVLDRHGTIIAVNDAWTAFGRANGIREESSISPGANYLDVCRRAVEAGDTAARQSLDGIQAVCDARDSLFVHEYQCDAPGAERWFEMKVVPLRRPEGGVLVTHRETTVERRQENALRESEKRFRLLADALPVGVWMVDLEGRCLYVNRTWTQWTGRPLERELGNGWTDRIHPDDAAKTIGTYREALAARKPFTTEFRLQRRDGRSRWLLNTGRPRYDDTGAVLGFVGGCVDMTDRLDAQARLRELSGRLIGAQEEERRRVARELHDDLQQRLALLAIELEGMALGRPLGGREDWASQARRLWKNTNEISSEVHRISHRLLPLKLETLGLLTTIESYCRDMGQQGVRTVFTHSQVPASVPDDVELCVFRVIQESLRNVVKHSGAGEAHVALSGEDGSLHLVVADQGRGFEVDAVSASGGLGLFSMRERLRVLGGELRIKSAIGSGTSVEVRVPLRAGAVQPAGHGRAERQAAAGAGE